MKRFLLVTTDQELAGILGEVETPDTDGSPGCWKPIVAPTAAAAWKRMQAEWFDAVVLDARTGEEPREKAAEEAAELEVARAADGSHETRSNLWQLLRRLQQDEQRRDVPVVVLVSADDLDSRRKAWQWGAADVVCTPVLPEEFPARLARLSALGRLKEAAQSEAPRDTRKGSTEDVSCQVWTMLKLLWRLAAAAEYCEGTAALHVVRVGLMSHELALALELGPTEADLLLRAAPLHDVGNLAVPREIFQKPEPLSPDEWELLKQHCRAGARLLEGDLDITPVLHALRPSVCPPAAASAEAKRLLHTAAVVALTHHERWNGSGYPQGLREDEIPLEGRIVGLADTFDSLTSPRPYRGPYDEQTALEIMENTAGKFFDPEVYGAFLKALPRIRAIRRALADSSTDRAAECVVSR